MPTGEIISPGRGYMDRPLLFCERTWYVSRPDHIPTAATAGENYLFIIKETFGPENS